MNAPRQGREEILQPLPGCASLFLLYPGVRFAHPRLNSIPHQRECVTVFMKRCTKPCAVTLRTHCTPEEEAIPQGSRSASAKGFSALALVGAHKVRKMVKFTPRNPKLEFRNPKQIQNPNFQITKTHRLEAGVF